MPAYPAGDAPFGEHAARLARVAFLRCALSIALTACQPTATVGAYSDAGERCDPVALGCGPSRACSLRGDPSMDACRDVDGLAVGAPCTTPDACAAGGQCVALGATGASLAPPDLAAGTCARICPRDRPICPAGERCIGILAGGGGVRIDYGVCGR